MKLKLIVAMCKGGGIGFRNDIPWNIKKDLLYFSNKTTGDYGKRMRDIQKGIISGCAIHDKGIKKNATIMGKNTWLSLPKYPEPLKNRDNIVLSSSIPESIVYNYEYDLTVHLSSISRVMRFCMLPSSVLVGENEIYKLFEKHEVNEMREINRKSLLQNNNLTYDEVWIIGGEQVYNIFIEENVKKNMEGNINMLIDEFCITYIDKHYECDTFFPNIENMNLYYISSFSRCENLDENTGIRVPVYYIIFTLIDYSSSKSIEKKYIEGADMHRYYYVTI
jgi:dihydrofolate reductase